MDSGVAVIKDLTEIQSRHCEWNEAVIANGMKQQEVSLRTSWIATPAARNDGLRSTRNYLNWALGSVAN